MKGYLTFLFRVWRLSFQGSGKFYAWMSVLSLNPFGGLPYHIEADYLQD